MKESMNNDLVINAETFTIATQMYVRLRRVCGRVIDVMYLVNNEDYAKHVLDIALETQDQELKHLVMRLSPLIDLSPESNFTLKEPDTVFKQQDMEELSIVPLEVTEDDVYQAQIPHHYIGALR